MAVNDGGFRPEMMTSGMAAREREPLAGPSEAAAPAAEPAESTVGGGPSEETRFDPMAEILAVRMWLDQIFRE